MLKGWYIYDVHKNCLIFKTPHPLVQLRLNFLHPLDLGCPISNESSTPNDNQSIKIKHNPRMNITYYISGKIYYISAPSFSSAFVFSINSLILPRFLLTSFHLAEASLSAFSWLYTLVCAVAQKYYEMPFIYNYSHFQYSFCNQPVLFAQLENVHKLWNRNRTEHMNERNQNKSKTKSRHIQINHVFYWLI